jgi:hypothetical protein
VGPAPSLPPDPRKRAGPSQGPEDVGLTDWIRERLLAEGKIDAGDLELLATTDSPEEACRMLVDRYQNEYWKVRNAPGPGR